MWSQSKAPRLGQSRMDGWMDGNRHPRAGPSGPRSGRRIQGLGGQGSKRVLESSHWGHRSEVENAVTSTCVSCCVCLLSCGPVLQLARGGGTRGRELQVLGSAQLHFAPTCTALEL